MKQEWWTGNERGASVRDGLLQWGAGAQPCRPSEEPCGLPACQSCLPEGWGGMQSIYHFPALLPGKSRGRRSLVGCSPWGRQESDTTERLHFHVSLSCIGEGNGHPLQCSCLENPRDRGAWWAAVSGVTQSWTWLKRLSSSSRPHWLGVATRALPPCTFG